METPSFYRDGALSATSQSWLVLFVHEPVGLVGTILGE